MKYIRIHEKVKAASVIGAGCMRIADMNEKQADTFVRSSLDAGINFFDEADIYGGGRSEEVLGKVLAADPSLREKIVLQSKCGIRQGMYDFSKDYILKSVDGILSRLQTDHLDLLLLHRPDALMEPEEVSEAFDELETAGKVLAFGVSNENPYQMAYLQSALKQKLAVNQVQLSCAHTAMIDAGLHVNMNDEASVMHDGGIIPYVQMHHMTLQAWSPLQMGFFAGVFLNSDRYPELNARLKEIGAKYAVNPDTVAYAWILRIPGSVQVIAGTTRPERLASAAEASDIHLTREEWYDIYRSAGNILP